MDKSLLLLGISGGVFGASLKTSFKAYYKAYFEASFIVSFEASFKHSFQASFEFLSLPRFPFLANTGLCWRSFSIFFLSFFEFDFCIDF